MNQKEINELRRRFRPEKSTISRVYGCYVNSSKEIVSDLDESLGMMPQEESEKYLSLLKKGLSGSLGKNLIDIVFSTQQVADSEGHRLLTTLRDSQLKDNEARQTFYRKVINSLDMGDSSYLLLLACDSYDVPHRGKDDSLQADASDEVFTYIVCVVCPIKEGKVELGYFPGDNEFHCAAGQTVASPELGFLFPAFDDRAANIPYIYSKEDLSKLFKEMDSLQPSLRSPTKHLVVSVIFRMIYCCGLRPVEARRLRREDVNLFDGTVNILESKGHKDRIVVLSEDMRELCRNYDQRVEAIHPERRYFFQSPSVRGDGMYSMEWIIPTFRKFLQTAGISGYGEIRPKLYDLRHTFATHRLYQWVKGGKDINACLAYLSEYMGHSNLESTAYYIHLLPTLYTDLPELHLDSSFEMEADLCD